jgi:hypothetical protein
MCAARKQRLTREAIGGSEVGFPEGIIRGITAIALVLLVALAAAPRQEQRPVFASYAIDARAPAAVPGTQRTTPAGEAPAEGNVVDLTY